MAYIVTARKWRPQRFSDVVGQEHITTTLKNAIKNNRIAHAYIFTGPRGVGKTTTARILAKSLNCLNPIDNEPCNECDMCKSIQTNQSLDIIEIDGASNRGIDEIRTLRDSVKYAPTNGKYKVYIIDEVHMLTRESFNAFLKTLEEPPSYIIFIFATTDIHKVPLTIISRCQRFDFRRIQLDTIKDQLQKIADTDKIKIDDKTLTIIAKKSDGALRDAESFFDQVVSFCGNDVDSETVSKMLNLVDDEVYFILSDAVLQKNFKAVFEVTNIIYEHGWNFIDFMEGLMEHFRNIMTVILSNSADLVETADLYKSRYLEYRNKFSEGDILRLLNFLNKTQQELRYTQNQKLKIEISLSQLIGLEKSSTITELISLVDDIKKNSNLNFETDQPEKTGIFSTKETFRSTNSTLQNKPDIILQEPTIISLKDITLQENKPESGFNFSSLIEGWSDFVASVSSEKGLIFGPFIQDIKLLSLEGNRLFIFSDNPDGDKILSNHEEYFQKKTNEFFGKKLKLELKQNDTSAFGAANSTSKRKTNEKKSINPANDPIIDSIVNLLGGEEIQ
ncbi:MAG: DNA polymerase III subunit gamma/tau [Ignavibacteriaceae bacterium]